MERGNVSDLQTASSEGKVMQTFWWKWDVKERQSLGEILGKNIHTRSTSSLNLHTWKCGSEPHLVKLKCPPPHPSDISWPGDFWAMACNKSTLHLSICVLFQTLGQLPCEQARASWPAGGRDDHMEQRRCWPSLPSVDPSRLQMQEESSWKQELPTWAQPTWSTQNLWGN